MLSPTAPAGWAHRPVKYGPYSPSRLIVARCPMRFFGQYIRKDRAVTASVNAARGSAIHHVLAKITGVLMLGDKIKPSDINQWVSEAIGIYPAAYEQVDMVRGAANAYVSNPSPYMNKSTSCEAAFAVAFYEEESFVDDVVLGRCYVPVPYDNGDGTPNRDAFFGGRLDQISVDEVAKIVTILDHKSTPNKSRNEDHNFQVGSYAWLVSLFYPGYKIRTVLHYAHPELNCYAAPEYWSHDELKNFEGYIQGRIWAIENFQSFPSLPGSACDYCHIKQECPDNLALMEQRARGPINLNITGAKDLERIAAHVHSVGTLYDELNKVLKKGVEEYSPAGGISIEGITYKFKASDEAVDWVSTDLRIREEHERAKQLLVSPDGLSEELRKKYELMAILPDLAAVLKHWGVDPGTFKEWHSQKFKNLWRLDKPVLLDMLKEYVVKDRSTRWGAYKN